MGSAAGRAVAIVVAAVTLHHAVGAVEVNLDLAAVGLLTVVS